SLYEKPHRSARRISRSTKINVSTIVCMRNLIAFFALTACAGAHPPSVNSPAEMAPEPSPGWYCARVHFGDGQEASHTCRREITAGEQERAAEIEISAQHNGIATVENCAWQERAACFRGDVHLATEPYTSCHGSMAACGRWRGWVETNRGAEFRSISE